MKSSVKRSKYHILLKKSWESFLWRVFPHS